MGLALFSALQKEGPRIKASMEYEAAEARYRRVVDYARGEGERLRGKFRERLHEVEVRLQQLEQQRRDLSRELKAAKRERAEKRLPGRPVAEFLESDERVALFEERQRLLSQQKAEARSARKLWLAEWDAISQLPGLQVKPSKTREDLDRQARAWLRLLERFDRLEPLRPPADGPFVFDKVNPGMVKGLLWCLNNPAEPAAGPLWKWLYASISLSILSYLLSAILHGR